ncbi:class I SAM-dependent RNA methyltransferase [Defluviimonas sp. WL0002]|uniref:Class I SAM-dependent RNA methyltransferase n=1 Tax=Albidovulum marisflavi TaxID=2984159 RepID=A0ABT2Z8C7_9RHOB|nr:class I SAM-dependent RNA methyltransferase [Defluviimonas sp. WL0002]MCV2867389.1 class I SAM-dependent RNA methyltransferase [Defluviimonas sp. WL0002]
MRLTVERLGHLGDGIAPGPVFVAGALPGEVVEGAVEGNRVAAPRIVAPSPDRVRADCPHYRACGGCSLMHASDAFLAGWKQEVVRSALEGQGLAAPVRGISTSAPGSRRRATLSGRRTKNGVVVGFHGRASDTVTAIPDCRLLRPELLRAIPAMEEVTSVGASRKGELSMTATLTEGGIDLAVTGGKPLDSDLFSALAAIAGGADFARLTWEGESVIAARPAEQRFGRTLVAPPPGGFLQATHEGEASLVRFVVEAIGSARRVADLFAGSGTFTLPILERCEVHAAEGERSAITALDAAWRRAANLRQLTAESRDLFRRPLTPDELAGFDAVVIDPPRAGAEAQFAQLAASGVPVVAAVSCNPVTFAHDARIMADAGYTIDWIEVVDQFRWSPHVELVARLSHSPKSA